MCINSLLVVEIRAILFLASDLKLVVYNGSCIVFEKAMAKPHNLVLVQAWDQVCDLLVGHLSHASVV